MPWPLHLVWRYLATATALGAALGALTPAVGLPAGVAVALTVAGTATLGLAWRAATWPPSLVHDGESAGERPSPYGRDLQARLLVDRRGYLFAPRVLFSTTGVRWRALRTLPEAFEERFAHPVPVVTTSGHTWWMAGNEFYRVTADYSPDTARAVVEALRWRRRPRLDPDRAGAAVADRREEVVRRLRPSLGRHAGVVCVSCRSPIDVRTEPVAELWTQFGLRRSDVTVLCEACEGGATPPLRRRRRWRRGPDTGRADRSDPPGAAPSYRRPHAEDQPRGPAA